MLAQALGRVGVATMVYVGVCGCLWLKFYTSRCPFFQASIFCPQVILTCLGPAGTLTGSINMYIK